MVISFGDGETIRGKEAEKFGYSDFVVDLSVFKPTTF